MEKPSSPLLSVSDFIETTNQTLEYAFVGVEVEGEVAGFKVNQSKYVFFDLKDEGGSLGCFMTVWQLRQPIEDGMKVIVTATPKLTDWGKFSLTVRAIRPSGEGSLKKSFELLRQKLENDGVFDAGRKRPLPELPQKVAVISSTQAAGYADFVKIVNERYGGLRLEVAQVQVQGSAAPDQMIRALKYFNTHDALPDVIVIIRGGGSADDLSAFNDELLVREIAASRVPTLVGVGHETDTTLADMAADQRAATPSHAAQLLVPSKHEIIRNARRTLKSLLPRMNAVIDQKRQIARRSLLDCLETIDRQHDETSRQLNTLRKILRELDPKTVLSRGYALVRGEITPGRRIEVEKSDIIITAEVIHAKQK